MMLMARDVSVILSVYENRFLRRDQIQRLHFADASLQATSARLKKLSDHKFLDKLQRPVAGGASQAVYALDKRGADVVAAALEINRHKIRWSGASNRVEWLFMEHTLAVGEEYGFNHFRVITVCESERRLDNLRRATGKAGGQRMFLFTTCRAIQENSALGNVWLSPVSDLPTSLLD